MPQGQGANAGGAGSPLDALRQMPDLMKQFVDIGTALNKNLTAVLQVG
jgi:hypothetical protein